MLNALFVALIAFGVSVSVNMLMMLVGEKKGVGLDHPSKRKVHKKPVVRLGGIGIFVGLLPALFFMEMDKQFPILFIGGIFILLIGLYDDLYNLNGRYKILLSALCVSAVIWFSGLHVESLGNLFGAGEIHLGSFGVPFTVFAVVGVISAINFIDGLNGLAGGLSLLSAIMLLGFGFNAISHGMALLDCAVIGALLGFLIYNFPHGKIFMGDSGCMFLGYWLSMFSILLFGHEGPYEPTIAVLLLFIPIFDLLRVVVIRVLRSVDPLLGDKRHLHHIIHRFGVSHQNSTLLLLLFAFVPAIFALITRSLEGWQHLLFLLVYASFFGVLLELMVKNIRVLTKRMKKMKMFYGSRKRVLVGKSE